MLRMNDSRASYRHFGCIGYTPSSAVWGSD